MNSRLRLSIRIEKGTSMDKKQKILTFGFGFILGSLLTSWTSYIAIQSYSDSKAELKQFIDNSENVVNKPDKNADSSVYHEHLKR